MNILSVNLQNNNPARKNLLNNCQVIQPKYAHTFDTVSFGSEVKFADLLRDEYEKDISRMKKIATRYLDTLECIASSLKEHGVSFDRAYCEQTSLKSPASCISKVVRSKTFMLPDVVRATLYMNKPYDLSILNDKLLPEMQKRGYILADAEMSVKDLMKRGYLPTPQELANPNTKKTIPDLDIRLDNVTDQAVKLAPGLKYSIGKPQESGYEDIQMRFVRDSDPKKNPIPHELIILFGPEYAKAKHIESEKVYSFLRKLDELNMQFEDKTIGSNQHMASRYAALIKKMFRGKISENLFFNAKNKDLYDIEEKIPVHFSDDDITLLKNYFADLQDKLAGCYKDEKKKGAVSKTVINQLNANRKKDMNTINDVQEGLNKTIEYFNYQNDLEK